VLLFGTGNRYGRAVDRMHELADLGEKAGAGLEGAELQMRIRQLEASEARALLIVRALTCFYTAVAGFVASTLATLIGAALASTQMGGGVFASFAIASAAGATGVFTIITGSLMLARETTLSFRILKEERSFIGERVRGRVKTA